MNEDADSTTTSPLSVTTRPPRPAIDSVEFYGEEDVEIHFTTPGIENWSGRSVVIEQSIDGGEFEAIGTDAWDSSDWDTAASVDWEDVEGTVVSYRVYVTGNGEESDYSNVFTFVRQPHGPSSLHDVSSDTDSIELEWIDHSTHEEGFELVVTPADGSGPWTIILDANTTSYTVEGLDEATEYSFELWSFANGERSQESSGSISAITKLAAPTGLSVTAPNAYETNLSWADVSNAEDGYIVTYYKDTTAPTGPAESLGLYTAFAPVNATGFSIIGLNADTLYSFKVHAYRDIVDSSDPEETIRIESPIAGPATATTDEAPAAGTQYRFHFDGSPMVSDTIFTNTGTLTFNGPTAWTTGTPPNVTAGYVQSNVSGTIVSTRVGWQTENFSYPGSAFTTYADGTSHGVITMEDTTNRGGPIPPHDGEWHLEREIRVIDGTYVSIEAVDDEGAEEDEDVLTFRVTRSADELSDPLTVYLHPAAGSATSDDYETEIRNSSDSVIGSAGPGLPASVTIPAGDDYVTVRIIPVDDDDYEGTETVYAILKASNTYWLTTAFMAEGTIEDNDVAPIDIRVDSNNDGKITEADDAIEDDNTKPGKIIPVNDVDFDQDGIPDFADGYDPPGAGSYSSAYSSRFVPIQIRLPAGVSPANATLEFEYDESDPLNDMILPNESESGTYEVASGSLRLWTKDARVFRRGNPIYAEVAGEFIPSSSEFVANELTWSPAGVATIWVEAVSPSNAQGDLEIELTLRTAGQPNRTDSVRVTAVKVEFIRTFSDQIADVDANYLDERLPSGEYSGKAGNTGRLGGYILAGTRSTDNKFHARAQVSITPDSAQIREKLAFTLLSQRTTGLVSSPAVLPYAAAPSAWHSSTTSLSGNVLRVSASPFGSGPPHPVVSMRLMYGVDHDGDAKVTRSEFFGVGAIRYSVVQQSTYDYAKSELATVRNIWSGLGLKHAANFMHSFLNDLGTSDPSVPPTSTIVDLTPNAFGLDHNVGAAFSSSLVGPIRRNNYGPTSQLAQDIVNSTTFYDLITEVLTENKAAILAGLGTPSLVTSFNFSFNTDARSSVNFADRKYSDADLLLALGRLTFNNGSTPADTPLTITGVAEYGLGSNGWYITTKNIVVSGKAYDLYDFDYSSTIDFKGSGKFLIDYAAQVQAGYGTLGTAGRVFETVVELNTQRLKYPKVVIDVE